MAEVSRAFGLHTVSALLRKSPQRIRQLLIQQGRDDDRVQAILNLALQADVKVRRRAGSELDALAGGNNHQGVLAEIEPAANQGEGALDDLLEAAAAPPLLLVLDGVQDPHNLGACLRTADACGVAALIVPRDRAAGLTPVVRKVASGAAESVPLIQVVNLARTLRWLKERNFWIVGSDESAAQTMYAADLTGPSAIVMGAEGQGMRRLTRELCDVLVKIPMHGIVESLNVSVASGVLLFEAVRQRSVAKTTVG